MRQWTGSVAFVTGGARGIGLGIARSLAKRGVRLALADVDEPALERAADELTRSTAVRTYRLDVRDRETFEEIADDAERELGPVDLLFNNAGVVPYATAEDLTYETWDLVLAVNLTGVVNGIQTFLPRMIGRRAGHVVNTASGAGLVADANVPYVTSKFAVVGLSESLRLSAVKHGVGVSVLCPGPVDTGIVANTGALHGSLAIRDELVPIVQEFLRSGPDIDEVGEMVLAAMEAGKPWIFTGDDAGPHLRARTAAVLECL